MKITKKKRIKLLEHVLDLEMVFPRHQRIGAIELYRQIEGNRN